ncbi:unnamed protein product [Dimorphilus gyrociliatus]|uniref:Cadherin domain-containing protein n=1 Tax=Dimorphilus gyrociliatus TaxID=2664684 RepID=A0A7I8WCK5_9ANNE|nr:unnamed protein product [Dimorphilus gyrociliatus]
MFITISAALLMLKCIYPVCCCTDQRESSKMKWRYYDLSIKENTHLEYPIFKIPRNLSEGEIVEYSIENSQANKYFSINEDGRVILKKKLDYEEKTYHEIIVGISFRNCTKKERIILRLTILDENDNYPEIKVFGKDYSSEILVQENRAAGTVVALIYVQDLDSGLNGKFSCELRAFNFQLIRVTNQFYKVVTTNALDRERRNFEDIRIVCRDYAGLSSMQTLIVKVADVNDNRPIFQNSQIYLSLKEGTNKGAFVAMVRAMDPDSGENATISYFFRSDIDLFAIDEKSGKIKTTKKLTKEHLGEYTLTAIATDHGIPSHSSTMKVYITISEKGENKLFPNFT